MAFFISDECTNCGVCEDACPVDAIVEKDDKRFIEPEQCTECGACVDSCPINAIKEN
jgi:MinD superfamily P-loop ATPase